MKKEFLIFSVLILVIFSVTFWWFGPRRENLVKQCSKEIFDGGWKISGEDERIDPLEKIKTMQDTCLMDKGIK